MYLLQNNSQHVMYLPSNFRKVSSFFVRQIYTENSVSVTNCNWLLLPLGTVHFFYNFGGYEWVRPLSLVTLMSCGFKVVCLLSRLFFLAVAWTPRIGVELATSHIDIMMHLSSQMKDKSQACPVNWFCLKVLSFVLLIFGAVSHCEFACFWSYFVAMFLCYFCLWDEGLTFQATSNAEQVIQPPSARHMFPVSLL